MRRSRNISEFENIYRYYKPNEREKQGEIKNEY